jgi:hypothetical protein
MGPPRPFALLPPLGYELQAEMAACRNADFPSQRLCAFGPAGKFVFWIVETKEAATPRHTACAAATRDQVEAFHRHGLLHGGKDNGAPGPKPQYHEHYFGAFLLDPDGNNVEAACHAPGW